MLKNDLKRLAAIVVLVSLAVPGEARLLEASEGGVQGAGISAGEPALALEDLRVERRLGKVEEIYRGSGDMSVILIQDAHAVPDAQKSIQRLIDYFQKEHGVRYVGLEGASSDLDATIFKSFPDQEKLRAVMRSYLEEGELTAGTASAVFNEKASEYAGLEDWDQYQEGLRYYLLAQNQRVELTRSLDEEELRLEEQKKVLYTERLLEADRALKDFSKNREDLVSVLKVLGRTLMPEPGSQLRRVLEEAQSGEAREASIVQEVRLLSEIFERPQIRERMPRALLMEFQSKRQGFQTSQISASEYALYLRKLADALKIPVSVSQALTGSMKITQELKSLEGAWFFREFRSYARAVKDRLLDNDAQRRLDRQSEELDLLGRFSRLELDQEDWKRVKVWMEDSGADSGVMGRDRWSFHYAFYLNAKKRDRILFERLVRARTSRGEAVKSAVMVSGGFHTEGLTELFRQAGISYAVLMPEVTRLPEEIRYESQMKGGVSWKDYFKVENGRIDLYGAFVRGTRDRLLGLQESEGFGQFRGRTLKTWRDQILRTLSREGRLDEAARYTRFLDEAMRAGDEDDATLELIGKVKKFMEGLKTLDQSGRLTPQTAAGLLSTSMIPPAATANAVAARATPLLTHVPLTDDPGKARTTPATPKTVESSRPGSRGAEPSATAEGRRSELRTEANAWTFAIGSGEDPSQKRKLAQRKITQILGKQEALRGTMDVLVQTLRQFRQDETSLKQSWFSWFSGAALRRNQSQQAELTSKIKSAQDSLLKLESELFNQRRILRQSMQAQRGLPSALSSPIYLSVEGLAEPEKEIYRRAFASGILESGKPLLHEDFRELQTWVTESDFTESIHKGRAGLNTGDRGVYRTDEVDIPVAPAHEVPAQMDRFLEWLNQTESTITPENVFSFAAEAYIRFIEIHPFKDGNGRTGRQLINLLLMRSGQQPVDLRLVNLSPEIAGFLEFLPDDAAFLGGLLLEASKGKSTLDRLRYGGRSKQDGKNAALAPAQAASIDAWDFLNWMRGQILWGLSGQKQIEDNLHKTKLTREQYAEFMKILEAALRKTRGSEQKKRTAAAIGQHFRRQAETYVFLESPRSELRNSSWKPYFTPEKLRGYDRVIVVDTSEGELSHPVLKAWFFFPNGIRDIFPNPKTKIQVKSQLLTIVNPGEKFEFIRSFPDDIRQDEKVLVIVLQGDWFITGSRYPKLMVRPTFIKVLDKAVDIITPRKSSAGKAFLDQAHDLRLLGIPSEVMPGEPNHLRPQDLSPEVIRERERLIALAQRQSPEFGAKSRVVVVNPLFGAGAYRENGKEFFLRAVKKILKDDPSVYVVINEGPPSWAWGMVSEFESMSEFAETPRQKIEQFYAAIPEEHAGRVLKLGTSASGTNDLHRVAALMTLTENVVLLAENSGLAHLGDWMRVPMVVNQKMPFKHYFLDRPDSVVPSTPDEAAAEILRMLGPQTVKSELRSADQDTVIIEPSEPADVEKLARLLGGKLGRRTAEIVMNRIDEVSLEREASASASKAGASGREDRLSRETQSIRNRLVHLLEEERRDGKPHAGLQSIYNHLKQRESSLSDHDKVLFSVLESAVPADPLSRQKPPAETTNWDLFESNLRIYSEGIKGIVYDLLMISLGLEALSESVRRDACKVCPHSTSIVNRLVSDFIQTDLGEEAKVSTVEAVVGADPRMRERGTAARHLWTEIVSPENGPRFYVSLVDSQFEGFGFDTTTDGRVTGKINVFRFSSPEERTSMLKARGIDLSGFIEDSRFIEDRLGSLSRLHDLLAQLVKSQAREDEIAPQSRDRWDFRYFQLSTMLSLAARFVQSDQSEDTLANARTVLEKAARYHARHKGVLGKAIDLKEIDLLFLKIAIMQTRIPIAAIRDSLITASSLTRIRTAFGGQELPPYLVPVFKDLEAMEEELHGVIAESLELMNRAEMITASAVKGEEEEFLNLKSFIGENDERRQLVKFILLSGDYPEDRRQKIFARLDLQAPEDQDSGASPRSELRRQAKGELPASGKNSGDATALSEGQLDLLVNYLARSGGIGDQIDIDRNGELFELVIALYREDAEALERNVLARVYVRNAEAVASLRSRLAQGETYAQRFAVGFVMPEGLNMDAVTQRAFFQGYAQGLSAGAGEVLFGGALPESLRQALQRLQADVKVRAGLGQRAHRAMTLLGNEQATVPVATLGTSAEGFKEAYFPLMLGGDAALAAIQDDPEKARLLGEITARSQIHLANLLKDPTTKLTAIEIKAALLKAMHLEGLAAESFFEVTGQGLSLNAGKLGDLAAEMKTSMLVGSSA